METILFILKLAGGWHPGLHLKIENSPFMELVIEGMDELGPMGLPPKHLTAASLARIAAEGYRPAAVVETSSGGFPAWLRHAQPLSKGLGTLAAKTLAEVYRNTNERQSRTS